MARATELQLHVSKPWGNSYRYDVGIESGEKLLRVQVKCTMHKCSGAKPTCAPLILTGPLEAVTPGKKLTISPSISFPKISGTSSLRESSAR